MYVVVQTEFDRPLPRKDDITKLLTKWGRAECKMFCSAGFFVVFLVVHFRWAGGQCMCGFLLLVFVVPGWIFLWFFWGTGKVSVVFWLVARFFNRVIWLNSKF